MDVVDEAAHDFRGTGRGSVEQGAHGAGAKLPPGMGDEGRDDEGGNRVRRRNARPDRTKPAEYDDGTPHVGGEVQRIGFQRLAGGLFRHPLERPGPVVVDDDRTGDDCHRPPGDLDLVDLIAQQAPQRLPGNPAGGDKQQTRLDKCCNALDLGVAVMVLVIGRAVGPADGEIGDDGGPEVDHAVDRFRQDAQRAGEHGGQKLAAGQKGAGAH